MKITVIGEVNHGKTSLVESLLNKNLLKSRLEIKDLRTRDLQIQDFKINNHVYYLLDCPGHSSYLNNSILPIPYSDLIIILFSAVQSTIPEKILSLLAYSKYQQKKILLVITKADLATLEVFSKRASKITTLLKIANIEEYQYCIYSTNRPCLREKLLRKIEDIRLSLDTKKVNNNTLVLRSFNKTKTGSLVKQYQGGIIGCLASGELLEDNYYYLNQKNNISRIKIKKIINPSNTNNDFITCQTSISGCYAASNNLKGAIITKEPLLRNRTVVLTIDKYTTSNQTFTNVHLVTGFSMYKVVLKKTIKDTYHTTIPYLSQDTFLIMSKTQKIWNILAFGKIRECSC